MSLHHNRTGHARAIGLLLEVAGLAAVLLPISAAAAQPPSGLVAGQQVKIEGHHGRDGRFEAVQIVLRDVDHTVKVEGRIGSVRPDKKALTVLGFEVALSADTMLYRGSTAGASRAELTPDRWIEVKGTRRGQVILAERVRIKDAAEPTEELEATIESVTAAPHSLIVLGRQVIWSPEATDVVDERQGIEPGSDRLRRDDDDQSREPWRLGSRVLVGGRLESAWLQEGNFDLDEKADRADRWLSRAQVLASAQLTDSLEAYTKLSVNQSAQFFAGASPTQQDFDVQEAYVQAHRVGGSPITIRVGRQRFRDSREWFFDEYLDAVRATATQRGWKFEGALAEGIFAGPATARPRKDRRHLLASAIGPVGRGRAGVFYVARDDRGAADDDPRWLGSTFDVEFDGGSRLWSLMAARRGSRGSSALGGWAMDLGVTLVMVDLTGTPALTLGYARASGDTTSGDGRDTTFRQTDLEDNSARMGGLRRLAYYGELFDPELSNLQVLTAAAGFRPARDVGVDVVLHSYLQTALRESVPSSAFDLDANGTNRVLGHELDGAMTFRAGRFDIDLAAGVFIAGAGLSRRPRVAFFWRPQVRLYF